jgi:hypothetical protein
MGSSESREMEKTKENEEREMETDNTYLAALSYFFYSENDILKTRQRQLIVKKRSLETKIKEHQESLETKIKNTQESLETKIKNTQESLEKTLIEIKNTQEYLEKILIEIKEFVKDNFFDKGRVICLEKIYKILKNTMLSEELSEELSKELDPCYNFFLSTMVNIVSNYNSEAREKGEEVMKIQMCGIDDDELEKTALFRLSRSLFYYLLMRYNNRDVKTTEQYKIIKKIITENYFVGLKPLEMEKILIYIDAMRTQYCHDRCGRDCLFNFENCKVKIFSDNEAVYGMITDVINQIMNKLGMQFSKNT